MCNRDRMFRINLTLINSKYFVFRLHDVPFMSARTSGLLLFQQPLISHLQPSVHRNLSLNKVSYCTALKSFQEHPSKGEHKHYNQPFVSVLLRNQTEANAETRSGSCCGGMREGKRRQVRMTSEACGGGSCAFVE